MHAFSTEARIFQKRGDRSEACVQCSVIMWEITGGLRTKIIFKHFSICRVSFSCMCDYSTVTVLQLFFYYLEAKRTNDKWKKFKVKQIVRIVRTVHDKRRLNHQVTLETIFNFNGKLFWKYKYLITNILKEEFPANVVSKYTKIDRRLLEEKIVSHLHFMQ